MLLLPSNEAGMSKIPFSIKTLLHGRAYLFAISVLALSIGISTAVFSLARAVIFHPLPFPNQDSLRVIWKADAKAGVPFLELSYPELRDLQQRVPAFQSVAVMPTTLYGYGKVILFGNGRPVQVESAPVSHDFFRVLGVHPILGRDFENSDEHPGASPVVILSNDTWRTEFHKDAKIIGRQITLNGEGYTVVGVMASDIDFPRGAGLWLPLGVRENLDNRAAYYMQAIARVKPGYSDAQVSAQVDTLFQRLAIEHPEFYSPTQHSVITRLPEYWTGSARLQLLISLGASFLLLITGCITASNLFLSRTLARRQEIATRSALGATTSQIFAQFLAEGLTAAFFAGSAGLAFAEVFDPGADRAGSAEHSKANRGNCELAGAPICRRSIRSRHPCVFHCSHRYGDPVEYRDDTPRRSHPAQRQPAWEPDAADVHNASDRH